MRYKKIETKETNELDKRLYNDDKGVGKDSKGETHHLTEKKQGTYVYTMGPYSKPVMDMKPGDTVVANKRCF